MTTPADVDAALEHLVRIRELLHALLRLQVALAITPTSAAGTPHCEPNERQAAIEFARQTLEQ